MLGPNNESWFLFNIIYLKKQIGNSNQLMLNSYLLICKNKLYLFKIDMLNKSNK